MDCRCMYDCVVAQRMKDNDITSVNTGRCSCNPKLPRLLRHHLGCHVE